MDNAEKPEAIATRRDILGPALAREAVVGESRVNWIRMAAIAAFYLQRCILFYCNEAPTEAESSYHVLASVVTVLWGVFAALLQMLLSKERAPWIAYLATSTDLLLVTVLVVSSPDGGPHSVLLALYPVLLAASALRFSLPLIYFNTSLAVLLYLLVLGHYAFGVIGYEHYYSPEFSAERIPRSTQVIFILSLLITGVIAGQVVRQARRLALVTCARVESDLTSPQDNADDDTGQSEPDFALDLDEGQ